jgi:hypothetical protein
MSSSHNLSQTYAGRDEFAVTVGSGSQFDDSATGQSQPNEFQNPNRRQDQQRPSTSQHSKNSSDRHTSSNGAGRNTQNGYRDVDRPNREHGSAQQTNARESDATRHHRSSYPRQSGRYHGNGSSGADTNGVQSSHRRSGAQQAGYRAEDVPRYGQSDGRSENGSRYSHGSARTEHRRIEGMFTVFSFSTKCSQLQMIHEIAETVVKTEGGLRAALEQRMGADRTRISDCCETESKYSSPIGVL